jgi:iron complex outermembrane receptor protein
VFFTSDIDASDALNLMLGGRYDHYDVRARTPASSATIAGKQKDDRARAPTAPA